MLPIVCIVFAWSIDVVDRCQAKTIVRLWHELHIERRLMHDFSGMLAPKRDATYVGVAMHDDVRAIAECNTVDSVIYVSGIAHAPQNPDAARILLEMIHDTGGRFDFGRLQNQPRWLLEATFVSTVPLTTTEE